MDRERQRAEERERRQQDRSVCTAAALFWRFMADAGVLHLYDDSQTPSGLVRGVGVSRSMYVEALNRAAESGLLRRLDTGLGSFNDANPLGSELGLLARHLFCENGSTTEVRVVINAPRQETSFAMDGEAIRETVDGPVAHAIYQRGEGGIVRFAGWVDH